ncbi:uncharacterized protein LOC134254880 [Saccostrea cucullata]|uniref:uncharacterized protein LOC134254880 n=1 Tax=Saccostrea cuccullata TaxID=36930 RepID=UPI002ED0C11E
MATSEDPTARAQDVIRCQLCPGKDRKSAASILCKSCLVNLCKDCVGPHMLSDPNIKQEVLTHELTKGDITLPCKHHQKLSYEFCLSCSSPVCQQCLLSGFHENHSVQQIPELYKSKKEMIENDKNELETDIAPKNESAISEIESMLSDIVQKHQKRQQGIAEFDDKCHKLVDSIIEKYVHVSKEMEMKDTDFLFALKSEFQSRHSLIQSAMEENESNLVSSDSSVVIYYVSKNEHFRNLPSIFRLTVPQFNPVEVTEQAMFRIIGVIPKTIKTNVKEIGTINTGFGKINSFACIPNTNEFFISGDTNIIRRMDREENLIQEIPTKSGGIPVKLAVTRNGYLVYIESKSKHINVMKKDKTDLIPLQGWTAKAICCTSNGDFLVAMKAIFNFLKSKVVRFSDSKVTQEIEYDIGKPLYCDPFYIVENKNFDIIVSDPTVNKLVIVDERGKLRFNYDGNFQSNKDKPFTPHGVTTNSMCHIFKSDTGNNIIHFIDQNGQVLLHIENRNSSTPIDLCTDNKDNLLLVESFLGKVKVLKLFEF